ACAARSGPGAARGGANRVAGWRAGRAGGGGGVGRSIGRNGTIFGPGSGVGAAGDAAAAAAGFAAAGGASGAGVTTLGSGAISDSSLATSGGSGAISGAGFGLTIVAAGLISAGGSSRAISATFFDRAGAFFVRGPSPAKPEGPHCRRKLLARFTGLPECVGERRAVQRAREAPVVRAHVGAAAFGGAPRVRDHDAVAPADESHERLLGPHPPAPE